MRDFKLTTEYLEYNTAADLTKVDERSLVAGSKNVLINRNKKVQTRGGYSRLGVANAALTPIRNAWTWHTSRGNDLPLRFGDDELEVYLGTVDTVAINAWTRVANGWSTTETMRAATWFDATENEDVFLMVIGDDNIYEWNGAVAVVDSITGTTITKKGTTTFAQNRFYTTGNKTVVCVRTGTEYTYTGGEGTTTLTGISDTTGLITGDILVQKIVTEDDEPASGRTNHTIFCFNNQIFLGSEDDEECHISQNDDYADFAFSSPRVAGEGGLFTLTDSVRGFGNLSDTLVIFCGTSSAFKAIYNQITVNTTLAETLTALPLKVGVDQGLLNAECVTPVGDYLAYLSNEPALRLFETIDQFNTPQLRSLSNPIKPDFDAETFTNACLTWHGNALYLSAPTNQNLYILEFVEDADGQLRRYWQPPQTLPVRAFSVISGDLHGHSSAVFETYKLFDGNSDINSDDEKLPIHCVAAFAYRDFKNRGNLKTFDEYFVEGEISPNTDDLLMTLLYDFGGATASQERTIDGTDEDILEETLENTSLGQQPLGTAPLGGANSAPDNTAKFNVIFEIAREDFRELQAKFETNGEDRYWSIQAQGPNVTISPRQNIRIKK